MILAILIIILIFLMIAKTGDRYYQNRQTKEIVRAIKGPTRTPITLGWKDPLLRKFLFVIAVLIGIVILASLAPHSP